MFICVSTCCWASPLSVSGISPANLMPWYGWVPCQMIMFFNAQYYAQRVIGNYYVRKAQVYGKKGIERVDLHNS